MSLVNKQSNLRSAIEQSIEETRRDFDVRMEEIKADLKESGPEGAESVETALAGLKRELQSGFDEIQKMFDGEIKTSRREIRAHPLAAVGIAVAAGVVIGLLMGDRRG
jgi:ElaB/YqjD/DUF883 family membrane-anchored ribosome-binding protein